MDIDTNFESTPRKFIFSDAYYDSLDKDNNVDIENQENIEDSLPEEKNDNINDNKEEKENYSTTDMSFNTSAGIINTINPEDLSDTTNEEIETNNIEDLTDEKKEKPVEEIKEENNEEEINEYNNKFFNSGVTQTTSVFDSDGNLLTKKDINDNILYQREEEVPKEELASEDDGKPDLGIPKEKDINLLNTDNDPKTNDSDLVENQFNMINNISQDVNLNVESGIDSSLENELLNDRDIYQPAPVPFDEYSIYRKDRPTTRYKATRRKIDLPENIQEEIKEEEKEEQVEYPLPNVITEEIEEETNWEPIDNKKPVEILEEVNYDVEKEEEEEKEVVITKSNVLEKLEEKAQETGKVSMLAKYGDDFCSHDYITNPAIGRDREIKELNLILLTPEKSAILVGKPGIGKTSIVEGLAYRLQRNDVPNALKGYTIISIKTTSLLGNLTNGETRLQTLIDELKELDKIILFIDEVHMLMGATNESSLDFANMFKEALGRGSIKMIGATTSEEYERYVLRDKAFVRRFQRVDVAEPTKEQTVQILMGTLPKIEKNTGAKLKYSHYIQTEIMSFITDITSEYKRVYGIGSRYPDICITLVNQAFSEAVFNNRTEVNIFDFRNAIEQSKNIYQDVIRKELINFDTRFKTVIDEENNQK